MIDTRTARRRRWPRRAFSLLELVAVIAIVGLMATAAAMRFGFNAVAVCEGERTAYQITTTLRAARRAAIGTGDDHYLLFGRTGGEVVGFVLYRETGSGDQVVDANFDLPDEVMITTASDRWEFGFDGAVVGATSASTIRVDSPGFFWTLTVQHGTGAVRVVRTANP